MKEKAKWKAVHRRKVEEFVEMLRSEEMSVEVKPAAVTPPKEATSDTKEGSSRAALMISMVRRLLRLFYSR